MPDLSVAPLEKTVERLHEGITLLQSDPDNLTYLDSVIKRFELAFEMSRTTLLKYMESTSANYRAEPITLPGLIRAANQEGLLRGTWEDWSKFREMRYRTAHTYDERQALAVAEDLPQFYDEILFLSQRLRERVDRDGLPQP